MPVTYSFPRRSGGTAEEHFYIYQFPGGDDTRDIPNGMERAMGSQRTLEVARQAGNGDWIVVADGRTELSGDFPSEIVGRTGPGGFGFGGLGATVGVLNDNYEANRSFEVRRDGQGWVTKVDDEVVMRDDHFHPFYIGWESGDAGTGFGVSL